MDMVTGKVQASYHVGIATPRRYDAKTSISGVFWPLCRVFWLIYFKFGGDMGITYGNRKSEQNWYDVTTSWRFYVIKSILPVLVSFKVGVANRYVFATDVHITRLDKQIPQTFVMMKGFIYTSIIEENIVIKKGKADRHHQKWKPIIDVLT